MARPVKRKADYGAELARLAATYRVALKASGEVEALLERVDDGPALFVASGGAFAVAQLAADLHHFYTGHLGQAITPLEFCSTRSHPDAAVIMFTASGRHPDAAMAVEAARAGLFRVIGVLTLREREQLPVVFRGDRVQVVTVRSALARDGFLATNSVMAMATALVHARVGAEGMPETLPMLSWTAPPIERERCLALFPPRHASVVCDLEARLHETGLGAVQIADYRNFAHGRHAGLARNLASTTVIALKSPDQNGLAERTLSQLPKATNIIELTTELAWPVSVLDLIVGSMKLVEPTARVAKVNPSRPGVAPFGRRLYHLSARSKRERAPKLPIARKLQSIGRLGIERATQVEYATELHRWEETIRETKFGGLVLDYDGTCCTTEGRFELPEPDVRKELLKLIQNGLAVGFASGRGSSLHRDLRKWVPRRLWSQIMLGLYNGALLLSLADDVADQSACPEPFATVRDRLRDSAFARLITVETHTHQVEARLVSARAWTGHALAGAARELFEREPALPVKIVASAHSVDIVAADTTKRRVLDAVRARCGGEVLAIGDQGHIGGNDFELLSALPTSLSVDRCSSDPTRCWNLDEEGHRGPLVLVKYLRAVRGRGNRARFNWGRR